MALTIGVDVGGTKIAAGVVDESGEILAKTRVPTPADPQWAVDAIAQGVRELKEQYPDVTAVGVGAPGFVSRDRSTVLMAPNIAWENEPLKQRVEELTGLETVVENDANCAAWAEFRFGAAAAYEDMVLITVGTGLGGGIVLDGRLHRGRFGVAGEIGHLNMVPDGLECGCGGHGCWEQYGSGRALRRYGRERAAADPIAGKRMLELNDGVAETIRGIHITEAAEEGDALALSCYAELADWLGRGMADLAALFDPGVFVLGGGVSDSGHLLLDPVTASFQQYLTGGPARPRANVVLASMGSAAGIAGAADLARI
ncbi:ROK family glucokinase [Kitasatospora sp. NA04385]|uniref:ROK family glucokinase n=1 Tax=Kitasatospora sp. NA04385 TaxID=2742135 RepID=UPI0015912678|nr:ROK family glucokinase [Kitasatospora sp. NA04385]QKW19235.1 ROK family glucokinase [Kitasatospora sp. NA04385]